MVGSVENWHFACGSVGADEMRFFRRLRAEALVQADSSALERTPHDTNVVFLYVQLTDTPLHHCVY
jgi:hypothetical protein